MNTDNTCREGLCAKPDAKGHEEKKIRTGNVHFLNKWGTALKSVTLHHRRGNAKEQEELTVLTNVENGQLLENVLPIRYETGIAAPFDYWRVSFVTAGGEEFSMKENFFCNISADDDGNVKLTIEGGDTKELYVEFSHSSDCRVSLSKEN